MRIWRVLDTWVAVAGGGVGWACSSSPRELGDASATAGQGGDVARINDLSTIGVRTIVVGLPGSELYADNLEEFARAGGAENPTGSWS